MMEALSIVFGSAFTAVVCLSLGALLLRRVGAPLYREERLPLALVTGAALLSLIVFVLCVVKLAYAWLFLAVGGSVLLATARSGVTWFREGKRFAALSRFWRLGFWAVFSVYGLIYLANAMAPEMSPDGSSYHLGLVGRYFRDHGFERITTHMYANLSQGIEMLFLFAYSFGRHSAAALVHFCFLIAMPFAILAYGRRHGFPEAGVAGALFFFVSPVVGMDGSVAYNDVATAAVLFATFYLLRVWSQEDSDRLLVPIGLLAGFCYAVKYTAAFGTVFAAVFVLWTMYRRQRFSARPLLLAAGCALLMISPWMIKNLVWVDNPVSPFFNRLFPNPYVHISFEEEYRHHMRNYDGLESYWDIPLEVTVRGHVLCGLLGPLFLLAPFGLLALRSREGRLLWLAAMVFGLPFLSNIGTRFLIPSLPYISLAMALVFTRIPKLAPTLLIAHLVLSWPPVIVKYSDPDPWRIWAFRWKQALRIETQDGYLRRMFPLYTEARKIEELVPEGEKVLTFEQAREAYTTRDTLVGYQGAWNAVLGDMLRTVAVPQTLPLRRIRFEFPAQRLQKIRVVQTNPSSHLHWSISEFRVYHESNELPRDDAWRLRAQPNPWDVQRAFDNSIATRWRSWESLYDGMFVEIDFNREETVDSVLLECAVDQPDIRLRLEGMGETGEWTPITSESTDRMTPIPPGLRRMITAELKRSGVRYFLIHEGELGREDFHNRAPDWGITQLAEVNGTRIYRID